MVADEDFDVILTDLNMTDIGGLDLCERIVGMRPDIPVIVVTGYGSMEAAIGAIRALREAGKRVPEDVSVVGFDDIQSAAFQNPGLTTVRQPLWEMGVIAAKTLLRRINAPTKTPYPKTITVEPELIVRASTAPVSASE